MSDEALREELAARGFVRIPGAFSRQAAARMEDLLWAALARRHGVRRDDRASWKVPLGLGLQGLRPHTAFAPIGGPATTAAIDALLGPGRWREPRHWGQFLVTFPVPGATWNVPHRFWHTDFPYTLPCDRLRGLLVLSYLNEVPPRTGATLGIEGSPGVVRRFVEARPELLPHKSKVARLALMHSHPWLKALHGEGDPEERTARFLREGERIDGVPVRVVELTGEPGDVVLGHPWLLHAGSPNCGGGPRFMRVQRIRADA